MANEITVTPLEVRKLIDAQMADAALPDDTINLNAFKGAAIVEVQERAPDYASLDPGSADAKALNRAADALTAALLVEAYPNLTLKQAGDVRIQRQAYVVQERIDYLRGRAEADLARVVGDGTATETMPVMFDLACGKRGR